MLTNNKKSYFVKGIAVLMAMLMVLSVCLTGCGKKADEAIQKAENAQTAADEAKTAADAVKAALADYLKAADAITKAEIEAMITDALAKYETDKDAKALAALEDKIMKLLAKDALEAVLEMDNYAASADLTALETSLKALIDGKADKSAFEALKGNSTLSLGDLEAKLDALYAVGTDGKVTGVLANYATKGETAEKIYAILKAFYDVNENGNFIDADGKEIEIDMTTMSAETIATLLKNSPLWSEVEWNLTTEKVIKAIDGLQNLLVKLYEDDSVYTKANKDIINGYFAKWGIAIFEDYSLVEKKDVEDLLLYTLLRTPNRKGYNELEKAIEDAKAVVTFKDEINKIYADLFAIGHKVAATDDKVAQIVTLVEVEAFNNITMALDEKIVEYILDDAFAGHATYNSYESLSIMYVEYDEEDARYEVTDKVTDKATLLVDTKGNEWKKAYTNANTGALTFVDYTAALLGKDAEVVDKDFSNYDCKIPVAADSTDPAAVYASLNAQFNQVFKMVDAANKIFDKFLTDTVIAYGKTEAGLLKNANIDVDELTDANRDALLEGLKIDMCDKAFAKDEYKTLLIEDVKPLMDAALDRVDCGDHTADGKALITELALYERMLAKVWGERFDRYEKIAGGLLDTILYDYQSVVYNFTWTDADLNGADGLDVTADYLASATYKTNPHTEGFIAAFIGKDVETFKGWTSATPIKYTGKSFATTTDGTVMNLLYFYGANNGKALDAEGKAIVSSPVADAIVPNADQLLYDLQSAFDFVNDAFTAKVNEVKEALAANPAAYEGTDPDALLNPFFTQLVAALDEVYTRYLLEDYKKVQINDLYVKIDTIVKDFSNGDAESDAALTEALKNYLTACGEGSIADHDKFKNVETLSDAYLTTTLDGIIVNVGDMDAEYNPETVGAAAYGLVDDVCADVWDNMIEMTISVNYLTYLHNAAKNLMAVYSDYLAINGLDIDRRAALRIAFTTANKEITDDERAELANELVYGSYTDAYVDLLNLIATADQDAHKDYLEGVNDFEYELKNSILSWNGDKTETFGDDEENVWAPAAYNYVGSAVREMDRAVNKYTTHKVDGEFVLLYGAN